MKAGRPRDRGRDDEDDGVADQIVFERAIPSNFDQRTNGPDHHRNRCQARTPQREPEEVLAQFGTEDVSQHTVPAQSMRGMRISTRRFFARPSGVSFVSTGTSEPLPSVWTRSGLVRPFFRSSATAFARSTERFQFDGNRTLLIGRLSVWPTTLINPFSPSSSLAIRAAAGLKGSRTSALPDSNSARSHRRMTMTLPLCVTV